MQNATRPLQSATADLPKASDSPAVATPAESASEARARRSPPKATTMHTLWAESRGFLRHNVQTLRRILPALEPDRAAHVRGTLDRLQRLNARFI